MGSEQNKDNMQNLLDSIENQNGDESSEPKVVEIDLDEKLSSSLVGGYSKKSVENYIIELHSDLHRTRKELEKQIKELSKEKEAAGRECTDLRNKLKETEHTVEELKNQEPPAPIVQVDEEQLKVLREENERLKHFKEENEKLKLIQEENEELKSAREENEELRSVREENEQLKEKISLLKNSRHKSGDEEYLRKEKEIARLKEILGQYKNAYQTLKEKTQIIESDGKIEVENRRIREEAERLKRIIIEKESRIEEFNKTFAEQQMVLEELSRRIEGINQENEECKEKNHLLEQVISEKELILQHYSKQEQENILIRQENEKAKKMIESLKETIHKIMQQMETQSEGLNQYVARTIQERDALKDAISEQAELKIRNVELLNHQTKLENYLKELKAENTGLMEALEKQKALCDYLENNRNEKVKETYQEGPDFENDNLDPELFTCTGAYEKAKELIDELGDDVDKYKNILDEDEYWLDDEYTIE